MVRLQDAVPTDVLVVGSGLGAIAAAKALADHDYQVVLVPGIGSSRSRSIDGGLIESALLDTAFGPGAPVGDPVASSAQLTMPAGDRFEIGSSVRLPPRVRYRRSELETWAMEQAIAVGAVYLNDFIEGQVLPVDDDSVVMTSERDERVVRAQVIALCEGADPRIALKVHLRPDYGPEDQLHFARVFFQGEPVSQLLHGTWRTEWGMPVQVQVIPQRDGTIVSVATRIENVMRASRSSKDALRNLMESPGLASLGIDGTPGEIGMELVALRRNRRDMTFVHDRLVMGLDFSGVVDPRSMERGDLTIAAGRHLAENLIEHELRLDGWPNVALRVVDEAIPVPAPYHDDSATGYLEEGGKENFAKRLAGFVRRARAG